MQRIFRGQGLDVGIAEAEALMTTDGIAFDLGVDERTGVVIEVGHELAGQSIAGKVLVCRGGKGSTAGSFSLLQLADHGAWQPGATEH